MQRKTIVKKPITVTVAIPALNEENNISAILNQILRQQEDGWKLDRLLILSDGSTDNTVKIVKTFTDRKIQLIKYQDRKGKPARINDAFKLACSEVVVIFDADIKLGSDTVISELINGFTNPKVEFVSGAANPLSPTTWIGKITYEGIRIWNRARINTPGAEMYFCEGSVRAFKKSLYKKMRFPAKSADDNFPFLYLKDVSKFNYASNAIVYFKIPATFRDALSQQLRYQRSIAVHEANFGEQIINKYYVIGSREKLKALMENLISNPFWTVLYLIFTIYLKLLVLLSNEGNEAQWRMITSTK